MINILLMVCICGVIKLVYDFKTKEKYRKSNAPIYSKNKIWEEVPDRDYIDEDTELVYKESQIEESLEAMMTDMFQAIETTNVIENTANEGNFLYTHSEYDNMHENQVFTWQVEVIGIEDNYIHVLHEGIRKWLFVGKHNFTQHSLLNIHIDLSEGIEDVLDVEVIYSPPHVEDEYVSEDQFIFL